MDRKTLEYMGDRVDKAREIIKKIDRLTKVAEKLTNSVSVTFRDYEGNRDEGFDRSGDSKLVVAIRNATVVIVADEIHQLEQELAAL